jgi:hypothetical protein
MKIMIEIGGVEEQWLVDRVTRQVLAQFAEVNERAFNDALKDSVSEGVAKQAAEISAEKLTPLVDDVLLNGFMSDDGYGRTKTQTVKSLIASFFTSSDNYRDSWAKKRTEELLNEAMKKEFQPQIDAAKKTLRERLDYILGEKVSLAVREAVGLK